MDGIIGCAAEVCVLATSDGETIHNPPKIPFISEITDQRVEILRGAL